MEIKGKKVLVFGSGKSGISASHLLETRGAEVILYDGDESIHKTELDKKLGGDSSVTILLGQLDEAVLQELDLVILSPGVPTDLPIVNKIRSRGIAIWGEVELAYYFSGGDVLAITGTNGKTTTTALLGEIMKAAIDQVYVVGNIGNPYTDIVDEIKDGGVVVAEISSFQLETIHSFHPKVSAILNITPDHLNRHHTMEEYIRVKENIAENQTESDVCVLNYEDAVLREFGEKIQSHVQVLFFSSQRELKEGIFLQNGVITYLAAGQRVSLCDVSELKLLGTHNHENVMAASAMALAYGIAPQVVEKVIREFGGVEHRIEFVCEKEGVAYYNDSKGTNPDAAIKGIQAMNRPTLLIGGGYNKDSQYEEWIRAFDGKVKELVLVGETREKIAETARKCGFTDIVMADTFEEAVSRCVQDAKAGDAVLLSPACASWGMFSNYEERGDKFKELVK